MRRELAERLGIVKTSEREICLHPRQQAGGRRGSALIPALMVVSLLAMLGLSMLTAGLNGSRSLNYQSDEYRLTSAVESVGILSTETLWSGYLQDQGGEAGAISSFRTYLDGLGITDTPGAATPPLATDGIDLLQVAAVPGAAVGAAEFDNVNVDALRAVRVDQGDSTQLYITISASTTRGAGIVNPVLNRAIQLVYTVEPEEFEGFDYGVLANNINCIFCHTQIDSADRYFNNDPNDYNTFEKIKVGTLESLMIRHEWDTRPEMSDWDADSMVAGPIYVRGSVVNQNGVPVTNWDEASLRSVDFDQYGYIVEDTWGDVHIEDFVAAGDPPPPGENLYLDYPTDYNDMPDGKLPTIFPPPFPDDGGIDPGTGQPTTAGAGNRVVDPEEFYKASLDAEGGIIAGIINVSPPDFIIDTVPEYADALFNGNTAAVSGSVTGNIVLTGTEDNPIVIHETVAIDGDLVINGYVKGSGSLIVSGNIYIPGDLRYLDGREYLPTDTEGNPSGPRTFGVAQDGQRNALGLASGGNILIGDYLKPGENGGIPPEQWDIVSGNANDDGDAMGAWSFTLAEMSIFNRGEWAKTQPTLPDINGDMQPNAFYDPNYMPRYYHFGDGDTIPIYNQGAVYFDPSTQTWIGDEEVPLSWDVDMLSMVEPGDLTSPYLYDQVNGNPIAMISQVTPTGGWLTDHMQKLAVEFYETRRDFETPMMIDGLLYTNNSIFGIVTREENVNGVLVENMRGQLIVNGALICADLGLLVPGFENPGGQGTSTNVPGSGYGIGLQLNYDRRVKGMIKVANPMQVTIKRTLWNPTANLL